MEAPYSLEEYIWLRGVYLRTLPQFAYLGDAIHNHVRQEVSRLFPHNPQDVIPTATTTQIFAMEATHGIDPYTPLPQRVIPASSPLPAAALPSPVGSTPPRFSTPGPPSAANRQDLQAPIQSLASPASEAPLEQPNQEVPARLPQVTEQMPPLLPDRFEPGISMASGQNGSMAMSPAMPRLSKTVPAPGVQAMSNRPVHNPVKVSTRGRRDIKKVNYAQLPIIDDEVDVGSDDDKVDDVLPSKKVRKTAAKSAHKQAAQEPKVKKNSRQSASSDKPPVSTVLTLAQIPASARADPAFTDVVNGRALPHNRDQARHAQGMRKHLLMAEYEASGAYSKDKDAWEAAHKPKKGKKKATTPAFHPDLMPEFFEVSNFAKGVDEIRCICGSNEDHNEYDWIACDTCNAWQHDGCMGEAVPNNKKDKYYCHVCDPYGHRMLLQHVRQAHTV